MTETDSFFLRKSKSTINLEVGSTTATAIHHNINQLMQRWKNRYKTKKNQLKQLQERKNISMNTTYRLWYYRREERRSKRKARCFLVCCYRKWQRW